jgi:hypothetical protein
VFSAVLDAATGAVQPDMGVLVGTLRAAVRFLCFAVCTVEPQRALFSDRDHLEHPSAPMKQCYLHIQLHDYRVLSPDYTQYCVLGIMSAWQCSQCSQVV